MNKKLIFIIIIVIIFISVVFIFFYKKADHSTKQITQQTMINLSGKKVAMIIASENFRDEEYFIPKQILEDRGVEIITASNKTGVAKSVSGKEVGVDSLVSNVNPDDFDAVVFIGGPGALENLDNEDSYKLAQSTINQGKILGAICVSPAILAKSGVLKDKEVTVWSSSLDKSAIKILEQNGAKYINKAVVVDGKIITANGPSAAKEFGEKIGELLSD
jgi:protease I